LEDALHERSEKLLDAELKLTALELNKLIATGLR